MRYLLWSRSTARCWFIFCLSLHINRSSLSTIDVIWCTRHVVWIKKYHTSTHYCSLFWTYEKDIMVTGFLHILLDLLLSQFRSWLENLDLDFLTMLVGMTSLNIHTQLIIQENEGLIGTLGFLIYKSLSRSLFLLSQRNRCNKRRMRMFNTEKRASSAAAAVVVRFLFSFMSVVVLLWWIECKYERW